MKVYWFLMNVFLTPFMVMGVEKTEQMHTAFEGAFKDQESIKKSVDELVEKMGKNECLPNEDLMSLYSDLNATVFTPEHLKKVVEIEGIWSSIEVLVYLIYELESVWYRVSGYLGNGLTKKFGEDENFGEYVDADDYASHVFTDKVGKQVENLVKNSIPPEVWACINGDVDYDLVPKELTLDKWSKFDFTIDESKLSTVEAVSNIDEGLAYAFSSVFIRSTSICCTDEMIQYIKEKAEMLPEILKLTKKQAEEQAGEILKKIIEKDQKELADNAMQAYFYKHLAAIASLSKPI